MKEKGEIVYLREHFMRYIFHWIQKKQIESCGAISKCWLLFHTLEYLMNAFKTCFPFQTGETVCVVPLVYIKHNIM